MRSAFFFWQKKVELSLGGLLVWSLSTGVVVVTASVVDGTVMMV